MTRGAGDKWNISGADFGASDKINKVTVTKALMLKSLAVYVESANATVVINFKQGSSVVHTKSFPNLAVGKQTLALDFNLNPGNYTIDALGSTGTLGFEASGAAFPYSFSYPGYISFTYNETWQNAWYGLYYDWTISTNSPCLRTEVKAVIDNSYPNCVINGVANASNISFDIFPNPAKDKLVLNISNSFNENNINLSVNNSFGQLVYSSTVTKSDSEITLDVNQFTPGIYYFKLNNIVRKVVIQH